MQVLGKIKYRNLIRNWATKRDVSTVLHPALVCYGYQQPINTWKNHTQWEQLMLTANQK